MLIWSMLTKKTTANYVLTETKLQSKMLQIKPNNLDMNVVWSINAKNWQKIFPLDGLISKRAKRRNNQKTLKI